MDKVRIGIIGCGGIANSKHMPSLKKLPDVPRWSRSATSSRSARRRPPRNTASPGAKVYTDYRELLKDKIIDVVHVLTPEPQPFSFITVDALEAGKHVMCEKPMAINSAEAQEDARRRQAHRQEADHRLSEPLSAPTAGTSRSCAKRAIWAKSTTRARRRCAAAPCPPGACSWTRKSRAAVPLIDIGTHALDLTLWDDGQL